MMRFPAIPSANRGRQKLYLFVQSHRHIKEWKRSPGMKKPLCASLVQTQPHSRIKEIGLKARKRLAQDRYVTFDVANTIVTTYLPDAKLHWQLLLAAQTMKSYSRN